jgi:hypothetical protein
MVGDHRCRRRGRRHRLRSACGGSAGGLGTYGGAAGGEVRAMTIVGPDRVGSSNKTDVGNG